MRKPPLTLPSNTPLAPPRTQLLTASPHPVADAVSLYPARLTGPGAPLHVLQRLQDWYVATYQDPIVAWRPATSAANGCHDSWIGAALHVELLFSLPVALLGVYRFAVAPRRGTSGPEELLLLVYAFETAFTTGLCMYDVFFWDPAVYSTAMKKTFLYQFYAPWLVLREFFFLFSLFFFLFSFSFLFSPPSFHPSSSTVGGRWVGEGRGALADCGVSVTQRLFCLSTWHGEC